LTGVRGFFKVFSQQLDEYCMAGKPLPRTVLDCGCGVGLIGICAAAALQTTRPKAGPGGDFSVLSGRIRSQDRDELARLFTEYNARKNQIPPGALEAHTEPLLAGQPDSRWDLILSNIPAKTGRPVLEDFIRRSAALLNPGGLVMMVAVHTLAGFFRGRIESAGARLLREEAGAEHVVFVYGGAGQADAGAGKAGRPEEREALSGGLLVNHPFYIRKSGDYQVEGIPLRLDTVYGAAGFDSPGGAVSAAIKLARRLGPEKLNLDSAAALLVHEPGQGFFPLWLLKYLESAKPASFRLTEPAAPPALPSVVLSGRNILALEAARHNIGAAFPPRGKGEPGACNPGNEGAHVSDLKILCAADLRAVKDGPFSFIAVFPEIVSLKSPHASGEKDWYSLLWEGIARLLVPGGTALTASASAGAERFDRKKPAGFKRAGDLRRDGFQATAYNKSTGFPPPSETDS
jgi:hypothetical protein